MLRKLRPLKVWFCLATGRNFLEFHVGWGKNFYKCQECILLSYYNLFVTELYNYLPIAYRIAVFSVPVLRDERVVVVGEQKPNCTDEEAFTWMNSVVPAVESIHGVNLYGIVLVGNGQLPRGAGGMVQVHEARQRFIEGSLHPVNLLMCPYQCVTNLPVPKPHSCQ